MDQNGLAEGMLLWEPSEERRSSSRLSQYRQWLKDTRGLCFPDYWSLWHWSTSELAAFWQSLWDYFGVEAWSPPSAVVTFPEGRHMPGASWFPSATLNYAYHALRHLSDGRPAIWWGSESAMAQPVTGAELRRLVGAAIRGFHRLGVGVGDRVAAILPNRPETVIAFLASAARGAIWASCAPEFGSRALVDRLRQIAPKVVLVCDGYYYGGRAFDRREVLQALRAELPAETQWVWIPVLDVGTLPGRPWQEITAEPAVPEFAAVPFQHPLWVVFSSGTTGPPKPILHSHGGILLEHLKAWGLHMDAGPGDRVFWVTTTGWMMWNFLVGALLVGAEPVLYDGHPFYPRPDRLWQMADDVAINCFGTSAAYLSACRKQGLSPKDHLTLATLKTVASTGSPLSPVDFGWVYRCVKEDVWVTSVSGGTDVCSVLVGGVPGLPVYAGEIQGPWLGVAAAAFNEEGQSVVGEEGELVVTKPLPSMPVGFYGDPTGQQLYRSYFSTFPGVWRHGDRIRFTARGSCVIEGRSDATLNRRGVRMGTAEIYAVVEALPGIEEGLAVEVAHRDESRLLLFVVPGPGCVIDDTQKDAIRRLLAQELSPRHVPDDVVVAPAIPKTLNGKKLEVPVKRLLQGEPIERVVSLGSVANPEALRFFVDFARRARRPDAGEGSGEADASSR